MFQSILSWLDRHPILSTCLLVFVGLPFLFLSPFLIRGWRRWRGEVPQQSGFTPDIEMEYHDELLLTREMRAGPRIPMHNRFMPDEASGPTRSLALVDQILGDQHRAHEEPGRQTGAPAPGEPGYEAPGQRIRVVVGAFTFILDRRKPTVLVEASPGGDDYPMVEIPDPWNDVVTALAFEVQRLREGWDLPSEWKA